MPRGGARPGSGPKPDPTSARQKRLAEKAKRDAMKGAPAPAAPDAPAPKRSSSRSSQPKSKSPSVDVLGHRFGKLPRGGYTGRVPAWPLASSPNSYELDAWKAAWRSPQASAWATEPWRWRTVALWVRATVRCESLEAPAAIITASIKLADQIGMTPAGLAANGWEIEEAPGTRAAAEAASSPAAAARPARAASATGMDPRDRLKVIDGAGGR